ncbi:MAG: GNAT family N-acetyltransferase [Azospirillaceae bacterium]|nr:GNAT family N-acetyltransferase [Azospirillaceae bacterium]
MLALNNGHATELSLLSASALVDLLAGAWYARILGDGAALILAFDQDAAYDSLNFLWFRARYRRFVYIDRVVVTESARGQGLAAALYRDLAAAATAAGHQQLCCEVNLDPPNRGSDAFHAGFGFAEVGQARLGDRDKTVRYLTRALPLAGSGR